MFCLLNASVSSAKPEAVDPGGRLECCVPIRGTCQAYQANQRDWTYLRWTAPIYGAEPIESQRRSLSEVRKPGSGWVNGGGCTYCWSGRSQGIPTKWLWLPRTDWCLVTEVNLLNERFMNVRICHCLGVSLASVYAPTGVSEFAVPNTPYTPSSRWSSIRVSR